MQPPRVGLSLPAGPLPPPRPSRAANYRDRAASRASVRGACFAAASAAAALAVAHPATATVAAPTSPPGPRKPTFEFWAGLWSKNDLGFHKPTVHETLLRYRKEFLGDAPTRVLVPLCGKTHDLAWLATHSGANEVVGVEFVQQALEEFAKEHAELKLKKRRVKPQGAYKFVLAAGTLKLLCGDIFALPGDGGFDRVWDRASLVALDPVQRQRYAACITAAMAPRGVMLLQVLHRQAGAPLALQGGPPFSVTEADVKALYGSTFDIKKLESTDAMPSNPRFKASGLTKVSQVTYLLTKKA